MLNRRLASPRPAPPPQYSAGSGRERCQPLSIRRLAECSHRTAGCCGPDARGRTEKQRRAHTAAQTRTRKGRRREGKIKGGVGSEAGPKIAERYNHEIALDRTHDAHRRRSKTLA